MSELPQAAEVALRCFREVCDHHFEGLSTAQDIPIEVLIADAEKLLRFVNDGMVETHAVIRKYRAENEAGQAQASQAHAAFEAAIPGGSAPQ